MNKQELVDNGFKYIATQNCEAKTEMWARFSGYEDTIQYYLYSPKEDMSISQIQTTSYLKLELFSKMRDAMRMDFLKQVEEYDKECIWSIKNS